MDTVLKAPGANLIYGHDWSSRGWLALLGSDVRIMEDGGFQPVWTITDVSRAGITRETGDGIALVSQTETVIDGQQTWSRLVGGTAEHDYRVKCHITCDDTSEDERSILIRVRER